MCWRWRVLVFCRRGVVMNNDFVRDVRSLIIGVVFMPIVSIQRRRLLIFLLINSTRHGAAQNVWFTLDTVLQYFVTVHVFLFANYRANFILRFSFLSIDVCTLKGLKTSEIIHSYQHARNNNNYYYCYDRMTVKM